MSEVNWAEQFEKAKNTFEYKLEELSYNLTEDIIELMEKENISRKELAKKLGVTKPSISKLLNQGSNITLKRLLAIVEALNSEVEIKLKHKSVIKNNIVKRVDYNVKPEKVIFFSGIKDVSCLVKESGEEEYANAS